MIKIAFIHSSNKNNYDPFRNQPLVEMYLLTIIEKYFKEKVELSIIDLRGIDCKYAICHIPENDVYMYSISTPDFPEFYNILRNVRSTYPNSINIAGGPHINIFPDECNKLFDIIILGEGEESVINAINDILNHTQKSIYTQNKYVNLNLYPYPMRKDLAKSTIVNTGVLDGKYSNLLGTETIFSRGCPYSCHFCANKKLNFGPIRYRSPELIIEEIEYLKRDYNIKALAFKDDNSIPLNLKVAKPHLEAILKTDIKWRGQTRANGVHPDMITLAYDSGCTDIAIGIESVSNNVLKLINKKININAATKYIKLLEKAGINVRIHLIIGLPGEPEDVVKQSLKFIDETNPKSVLLSLLYPIPGSEIFERSENFGIEIETYYWEKYRGTFGRKSDYDLPNMIFHYKDICPWGKGITKDKIINNYIELQTILRDRKLNF